jgi:hypothetical protein
MKRNLSVIFEKNDQKLELLGYYGEEGKNKHTAGSGWSIDGTYSTDNSPQPTPHSSPTAKKKSMRMDTIESTIDNFSNLFSYKTCKEKKYPILPSTLSRTPTLLSFSSEFRDNYLSEESLTKILEDNQKSKPIPIPKNTKGSKTRGATLSKA